MGFFSFEIFAVLVAKNKKFSIFDLTKLFFARSIMSNSCFDFWCTFFFISFYWLCQLKRNYGASISLSNSATFVEKNFPDKFCPVLSRIGHFWAFSLIHHLGRYIFGVPRSKNKKFSENFTPQKIRIFLSKYFLLYGDNIRKLPLQWLLGWAWSVTVRSWYSF